MHCDNNSLQTTFKSSSNYWTNNATYNADNGLKSFAEEEAKFPAFSKIKFEAVCVGMTFSGMTKWLRINITRDSLLHIFKPGIYIATYLGRTAWKNIIDQSSLQRNCNKEGFNVMRGNNNVIVARIGYMANNENECNSPDSAIGFGMWGHWKSCGNNARVHVDNGERANAAFGYIMIQ